MQKKDMKLDVLYVHQSAPMQILALEPTERYQGNRYGHPIKVWNFVTQEWESATAPSRDIDNKPLAPYLQDDDNRIGLLNRIEHGRHVRLVDSATGAFNATFDANAKGQVMGVQHRTWYPRGAPGSTPEARIMIPLVDYYKAINPHLASTARLDYAYSDEVEQHIVLSWESFQRLLEVSAIFIPAQVPVLTPPGFTDADLTPNVYAVIANRIQARKDEHDRLHKNLLLGRELLETHIKEQQGAASTYSTRQMALRRIYADANITDTTANGDAVLAFAREYVANNSPVSAPA